MIPTDTPITFKSLQFPVRLAFAMAINKSQGQSMQICGLDLENSCFFMDSCTWPAPVLGNQVIYLFLLKTEKHEILFMNLALK